MNDKTEKIESYFSKANFRDELLRLRSIFIEFGLTETLKWGMPTYTFLDKNLASLASFKNHFGIWFFQGSLLSDPLNLLSTGQEKTIAMRQLKYNAKDKIDETIVKNFILDAMENAKNQNSISTKKSRELVIPEILKDEFDLNKELFEKFNKFSLTQKRDFTDYICSAKKEDTQQRRFLKVLAYIEAGTGLNDKYKKR